MQVDLINRMGDDLTVVNAARVSFNKESDWQWHDTVDDPNSVGFETLREKDQKLIQYLATHNHWTPFSHVQITMREKVPIFVARQRFKHQVGFTYNEESRRYVSEAPEFYTPSWWRGAPENKKQGSSTEVISELETGEHEVWDEPQSPMMTINLGEYYDMMMKELVSMYELMIKNGVAPEQARLVLPQATYTQYYVTGSLAAWARAYKLRIAPDAQKEIQDLAKQWDEIIRSIPELKYSWEALVGS